MTPAEIENAAQALFDADEHGQQIGLLSVAHPDMTMDDAYAVQNALIVRKLEAGGKRIGWKIGLTSRAMQDALKIDTPDSGVLLEDMVFAHGGSVPKGRFIQPRVEAEIAFVMKEGLGGTDAKAEAVIAATDYVAPALEILDTRILRTDPQTGATRTIVDTISDNAANAGVVMGDKSHAIDAFDLRRVGCILFRDDVVEETGLGAGVLNNPVTSVVWLARRMAVYGMQIEPGDLILSGSFVRPVEAPSDSTFHADYGAFGTVDITFQ